MPFASDPAGSGPHPDIRIGALAPANKVDIVPHIRWLARHGFESVHIAFWRSLDGADLPRLADEVREALEGTALRVSGIGIYGNPLGPEAIDRETLDGFRALIEHAPRFGTDLVAGFTGRPPGMPLREAVPAVADLFVPLAERAGETGLRLAFENCAMQGSWATGSWNVAHDPAAWELLFEALPYAHVGLEWEPCHQMLSLIDPLPQIAAWAPRIFHVHGKDCSIDWNVVRRYGINGDKAFAFHRTPGFGDSDWTRIIDELRRAGYRGSIDIEGWHDPVMRDALEMTGQLRALRYLKECRGGDYVAYSGRSDP